MGIDLKKANLQSVKIIASVIAFLWIIHFFSTIIPFIKTWGIYPREITGLLGIITSPLIHLNLSHIISNTTALIFLGFVFIILEQGRAAYIFIAIYFFSGLGTWLIGSGGKSHIGASGVIYGLMGYLLTIGIFRKHVLTIILSLFIFIFYGATLFGMLPFFTSSRVSWQAHLAGFIVGVIVAQTEAKINKN